MWSVYFKELRELLRDKKTLFFIIFLPLLIFPLLLFVMGGIVANITYDQHQQVLKYHIVNAHSAPQFAEKLKYHRDFKKVKTHIPNVMSKSGHMLIPSPPDKGVPVTTSAEKRPVESPVSKRTNFERASFESTSFENKQNLVKNSDRFNRGTIGEMIKKTIQAGEIDIVIVVSPDHQKAMQSQQQDNWQVYFNNASQLNVINSKFNLVFNQYLQEVRSAYLQSSNITENQFEIFSAPIDVETISTANQRENIGEKIGGILPYLLIMLCLTGAMYPAIDLGAGEKERKTLELLLLSSIPFHLIILGKFLTIMTTGIFTAVISVLSITFWGSIIATFIDTNVVEQVVGLFGFSDVVAIVVMILPISAVFSAILLSISIYARSFKEAQNYMGLVTMTAFFPVMIAMIPGITLDWFWACVPISNVALAIKELVKGTVDYYIIAVIFGSSLSYAVLSVCWCVHWFKKESVLFR